MPRFNTEVPHSLGQEQATERLKDFLEKVTRVYKDQVSDLRGDWADNVLDFGFTSYGFKISGVLTVEEDKARIEGKLPMAAAMFRGKIESSIQGELEKALK
ncbi:MAG: polyhydroxyalkanoic acid system family protein [Pirellulaceae bacterium]|jgi:putative polyhydroxyalkanoate system protein|nr:polyhydroxyalkanoic acid system family protein [Pirellulaceae bacterium]MDP7016151.1 polyhydroxyalkanoic acid system family protein [Pirellulaceae bacterium]